MFLRLSFIIIFYFFHSLAFASINISEYLLNKKFKNEFESKNYESAQNSISELLEKDTNNGPYLHNLGQTQLLADNPEEAAASFEKALPLISNDQQIHTKLNLAAAQLMQQKFDSAADIYKSILQENPANKIAKHNLELALQMIKQQQEQQQQEQQQQQQQQQDQQQQQQQQQDQEPGEEQGKEKQTPQQSELENELNEARKRQEEKDNKKKQNAYDILDTLSQREKDARKKHVTKQNSEQGNTEYDW